MRLQGSNHEGTPEVERDANNDSTPQQPLLPAELLDGQDRLTLLHQMMQQTLGMDRYRMLFSKNTRMTLTDELLTVHVAGQFALVRVQRHATQQLRTAARHVVGDQCRVNICLDDAATEEIDGRRTRDAKTHVQNMLPLDANEQTHDDAAAPHGAHTPGDQDTETGSDVSVLVTQVPPSATSTPPSSGARRGAVRNSGHLLRIAREERQSAQRDTSEGVPPANKQPAASSATPAAARPSAGRASRWAKLTLDEICVGPTNMMAVTAARMVIDPSESMARSVYFWGPAGTGKTLLLDAVDQAIRQNSTQRVVSMTGEEFTNHFTGAIRNSSVPAFRSRFRDLDVLLIDNVSFLDGKTSTLREMVSTVDFLARNGRRVIVTSDRPPADFGDSGTDLAGKFTGGLVCGIHPLDEPMRRSVLHRLADQHQMTLPDDLVNPLAARLNGDGRILSGIVNAIGMQSRMLGRLPTYAEYCEMDTGLLALGARVVTLRDINRAVADAFKIDTAQLQGTSQARSVSRPRMLAMFLARQYTDAAFAEIGDFFGNRSHSTVIAAQKRVKAWMEDETVLGNRGGRQLTVRQAIAQIENLLASG
ncbi:MAG: DnaA/Hda family protein [Planctomycetota bacterium]